MAKERILGLDLGTASVGFALIDYDRVAHQGEIVHMGVRIFPETRDAKTAIPLNQQRREKRLVRRQIRRRRRRRKELSEFLHSLGLLPKYGTPDWTDLMKEDPYELRRRGLLEKLSKFELGRALYHLSKRRHFSGRDHTLEDENREEEVDKQATEDRESLLSELNKSGLTLGEWLANLDPGIRKRNRLASRTVVIDEFSRLVNHQSTYWNDATFDLSEHKDVLHSIIFHQRPTFWRKNTLHTCSFIPQGELCPSASWLAQQRKMLEIVNNISIEGNLQPLDSEERDAILNALEKTSGLTWKGVRKALKPLYEQRNEKGLETQIKFNLEVGGMKKIPGNAMEHRLISVFGDAWAVHPFKQEIRDSLHTYIYRCDYEDINNQRIVILPKETRQKNREELVFVLKKEYNLSSEQALRLSQFELGTGWEPFSVEAIRTFLGMLQEGSRMGDLLNAPLFEEWRNEKFPGRIQETRAAHNRLPTPRDPEEQARLKEIRNPTVVRTQNELRKVVNNLLDL